MQVPAPGNPGAGPAVSTAPADGLPQSAKVLEVTCPRSVVTEPPSALWNGNGMSTLPPDGHNSTAPTTTASPITLSAMTTRRAARGPSGAGPCAECECATGYWR